VAKKFLTSTAADTGSAPLTPIQDATDFNASWQWETSLGLPSYIQNLVGTTIRDKPVYPEGANVPGTVSWQLDSGTLLNVGADGIITFGFYQSNHYTGVNNNPHNGEGIGYSPFTPAQMDAARIAIHNWDDLIAPSFQEQAWGPGNSTWAHNDTDILLANTTTGPAQAWAYYPGSNHQYQRLSSDVWIADPRVNGSNGQLDSGFYGLQTLNHELGHTLGLSHPGAYNFGADTDGDGQPDPITYSKDAFYFQDSNQFTIMSYFGSEETGAQPVDYNFMRYIYPSTPMVDDVYVIQQKYGADTTTRTGNTTYGFNSTSDVWNDAMKFADGKLATVFTIWDAGGHDKLDLSGYYTPSVIDLRPGAYSSAGGFGSYDPTLAATDPVTLGKTAYLAAVDAYNTHAGLATRDAAYDLYFGGRAGANEGIPWSEITNSAQAHYLMQQNIGIAYGAIIEDAIGGHGNDRINGNWADNSFTGGDGADTFVLANYSGLTPDPAHPDGVMITDTSVDTITDFHTGQDFLDVSSFAGVTSANFASAVQWDSVHKQLHIDTDANGSFDYTINVFGSAPAQSDFLFHA
jgi:serralysin